jgi:hypothetical protein
LPVTTSGADFSGVALAGVPGRTTTTIALGPGGASLKGVVSGPEGVVPGATVRVERLVGDGVAMAEVITGLDGVWVLPNVLGGRFRLRAWRVPDLALTKPSVFFLGATDERAVDLLLTTYTGVAASASIAPDPPVVGDPANLVVRVAQQSVEPDGVVRGVPISGQFVELVGGGDWRVESENPTFTDTGGDARWQVRCRSSGEQALGVLVGSTGPSLPLAIPPCQVPVVVVPSDDGTGTATTSTTVRRTTTTTRRPTTTTTR